MEKIFEEKVVIREGEFGIGRPPAIVLSKRGAMVVIADIAA